MSRLLGALVLTWTFSALAPAATIEGTKLKWQGPAFDHTFITPGPVADALPPSAETVSLDGIPRTSANPYFLTNVAPGPHQISVTVPPGWGVGSCLNKDCAFTPATPGNTTTVNVTGTTEKLNWWFTPPTGVVQGRLVDANGSPWTGAAASVIAGLNFQTQNPFQFTLPGGPFS